LNEILPANSSFQGGDRLCLLQIDLFSKVEVIHVSLKRKPSVLESDASRALIPCEEGVNFRKKCFMQITDFMGDYGSCFFKLAYSAELKKHMIYQNKTICVRVRSM
jgi:hypothetical protein